MALVTDKLIFLHVPKTGGYWIKDALEHLGLEPKIVGNLHNNITDLSQHISYKEISEKFVFCMVRNPISWYQSRWAFRMKNGWVMSHGLDYNTSSNDFNRFIENVCDFFPQGWCNHLFNKFCNNELVDYVGRTENLINDLFDVLITSGHDVDIEVLKNIAPKNTSTNDSLKSSDLAKYTKQNYLKVLQMEKDVISKYYSDYDFRIADIYN